jgi:hypothetical protein
LHLFEPAPHRGDFSVQATQRLALAVD